MALSAIPNAIRRITALWLRQQPPPAPTTAVAVPERRPSAVAGLNKLRSEQDRHAVIAECRRMAEMDPRTEGALATMARDAVRGGLSVQVSAGPALDTVMQAASDLFTRLRLNHRLDDFVRLTAKEGDSFIEVVADERGVIVDLSRKPVLEMRRNSNRFDRFDDPLKAYWQAESQVWSVDPPRDALWYPAWQVIHARWAHDEGQRYGRPLFASARSAWKRVDEGEFDVAIRRKTRAGVKYAHVLEGATPEELSAYREENKDALDDPFAAVADFFFNRKGALEVVQGDANLSEIGDIEHHIETWGVASPVPLALIGYGKNINRDILEQKLDQYNRALTEITSWVIGDIVRPLVELQWLLLGIYPASYDYEIVQPPTQEITPALVKDVADALIKLRAGKLPEEYIWPLIARLLPGLDAQAILQTIAEQPSPEDVISRLSQEAG